MLDFGCWMMDDQFFLFSWVVIMMLVRSLMIDWILLNKTFFLWYFSKYLLLSNNLNQYSVSLASLEAMDIFEIKSFVDWAACASEILAPMDVPLRSSWWDMTNSLFIFRYLVSFIISNANSNDKSRISFFFNFFYPKSFIQHSTSLFYTAPLCRRVDFGFWILDVGCWILFIFLSGFNDVR